MASNTKSACSGCRHAYNAINGLRCTRLDRYVDRCKVQPCTMITSLEVTSYLSLKEQRGLISQSHYKAGINTIAQILKNNKQ